MTILPLVLVCLWVIITIHSRLLLSCNLRFRGHWAPQKVHCRGWVDVPEFLLSEKVGIFTPYLETVIRAILARGNNRREHNPISAKYPFHIDTNSRGAMLFLPDHALASLLELLNPTSITHHLNVSGRSIPG